MVHVDNAAEEIQPLVEFMLAWPLRKGLRCKLWAWWYFKELSRILSKIDISPERFDYVTKRREELNKIKRKYGPELSDVIAFYNKCLAELEQLEGSENQIEILNAQKDELLNEVTLKAKELSSLREETAKRFIEQVTNELTFLDMPNVKLEVMQTKGKLTINGMDNIEF